MSQRYTDFLMACLGVALAPLKPKRRAVVRAMLSRALVPTPAAGTPYGPILFHCPDKEALEYPRTLLTREPDTIAWIDGFGPGEVLWDVGANVGAYALYAAKRTGAPVLAFEPAAATFALLVRNVELNRLDALVRPYCLAIAGETRLDSLNMAHTYGSSVMHAFGGETDARGGAIEVRFRQAVPGMTLDDVARLFDPPRPAHVKIDVDSIEPEIIAGGPGVLSDPGLRSVLVEVESAPDSPRTRRIVDGLAAAGLHPVPTATHNMLFRR